eukprot:scaffold47647_cov70-Cyclotella_meneghiniana.AAC.2
MVMEARVKKSSACMPVDWQSSPQHNACLSTPVVAGEKRGNYPPVDCDLSRLPAYDCSHRREMRRLPACRLRLSRRLAIPDHITTAMPKRGRRRERGKREKRESWRGER